MQADVQEIVAGDVRLRIEGLNRVIRQLSKAGADAQSMRDLMHDIGMLVVNDAHPPVRSGTLAGTMRAGKGKTKAVARAGGARIPYAGVIHYGWPARNIRPQPFLTEALQRQRGAVFNKLEDGLQELIEKTGLKVT